VTFFKGLKIYYLSLLSFPSWLKAMTANAGMISWIPNLRPLPQTQHSGGLGGKTMIIILSTTIMRRRILGVFIFTKFKFQECLLCKVQTIGREKKSPILVSSLMMLPRKPGNINN
jgi:hypothetical protein